MSNRTVTLCYRKIIDSSSSGSWEKLVFEDTYTEFLLQAQNYNPLQQHTAFAQLIQQVPGAEKLHYLVSAACIGYLQQLNEKIPDVFNILGRQFLTFRSFHFEIINSDITDRSKHQVAINFYSTAMIWHETVGLYLLLEEQAGQQGITHLLQLQPFLSIHSLSMSS